ncbi:MAG: hypothetical protein GY760_20240, partial [Deltaproteobacteria bacterium]|nr:hypothetical protein [Deltaproteobacteria bacterium]
GLPDGEYIVEISIISGRDRYSNYLNMVIDNTPPVISIPDFGSEFSDQSTVNFSADIEEANLDNYSVYLKDDNGILVSTLKEGNSPGTITDINFKPQTITDGEYFIEIVANDSSGNISKKAKSFTINHSGTEITLNSPVSNSINNKNIVFKGLLSDPSGVERYEIYVVRNNHTSLAFSESGNNIDYSYDSTQYYEKVYTMDIEIVAYDNIGNSTSLKRNIIIDNEPPTIGLTYKVQPYFVNGSLFINTNNGILLNAESNDIYSELDSIFYSINNRQWTKYNGSINIDTEGFHNIEYYAVDTIGNSSTIHTESIKVDNTDPDSIISVDDVTPSNINNMDFVNYYNKVDNWVSGEIGNGQLEIKEPVSLMQDIQIPITAEIIVVENGGIITNGFTLSYTDEFSYNEDLDPVKIYQQRVQTVLMIINQLLLE